MSFWDRHPAEIIDFWEKGEPQITRNRFRLISQWLKTFQYDSLLDVGCGNGNLIKYCKIPSTKYLGVDFSIEMLKRLKQTFPEHTIIHVKFLECDLPQSDIVIAHSFLEHQKDFWRSISKLADLANQGLLFNVLVSEHGSLQFNPHGFWERILGAQEYKDLLKILSRNFKVDYLDFYARSEKYVFCRRTNP